MCSSDLRWVISTALHWLAANPAATARLERVYVNLSGDSVGDPQLHEFIRATLEETRVAPAKIGFEITETAAIGNLTRANQLIADLRRVGCAFSLDDFGSGVSSFAYLKALTVDWLKIDGLFVGNIVHDRVDHEMVRSITDIGHVMGKKVVAEAVESAEVLERLKQIDLQTKVQYRGASALTSGDVAKALNLTDEQRDKLEKRAAEVQEELQTKIKQLQADARKKMLDVLTPDQQAQLEKMMGQQFDLPAQNFGNGFRGRGGRGGRGGGNPPNQGQSKSGNESI